MTRYFLGRDGGLPTPVPDDEPGNRAEILAHSSFYTEVQVVPLDAIVIDGTLPKVVVSENRGGRDHGNLIVRLDDDSLGPFSEFDPTLEDPDDLRRRARAFLAAANHLEQHPPVDEEQVATIRAILNEIPTGQGSRDRIARLLVERGARVGGAS
ncbi:hypothetical protein [Cellulosimicrobium sp. Marseille-Q8652]